ncbi:MAG: hypothetical protein NUW23_16145, partial [Firmicutes bacterium]|nr:hypothetical protein [Bacillota bacterium]
MRVSMVRTAFLAALVLTLTLSAGFGHAQAPSPVERLVAMENMLFGQAQQGFIVGRLESIERLLFGELGTGTLPERLNACWSFVQGDRAGGMNVKFRLKAVQWSIYGEITEGPIATALAQV